MKVLFVEDDDNKRVQVEAFVTVEIPAVTLRPARSLHGGLAALQIERPDLVLLDMSLPAFDITATDDGFQHLSYAGRDFLEHLDRHGYVLPVIVVTAFDRFGEGTDAMTLDELDGELRAEHPDTYVGRVAYSPVADQWRDELRTLIGRSTRMGAA